MKPYQKLVHTFSQVSVGITFVTTGQAEETRSKESLKNLPYARHPGP